MTDARALFARYLEQRGELGEIELFLERPAAEVLRAPHADVADRGGVTADAEAVPAASAARGDEPDRMARTRAGDSPAAAPIAATSPPVTTDLVQIGSLAEVATVASACTACGLAATRTNVVFADGNPGARLMVVGEAPGADEDRVGKPFVGRAGRLLDTLLAAVGLPRETVYICNVLKCRPPKNRNPLPEEVESCRPFLHRQIDLVGPGAILAVGTFPAQTLLDTTQPISRLRGTIHEYHGIPLVPTYHPAALLRNSAWVRPVWEDLQRLRAALDE